MPNEADNARFWDRFARRYAKSTIKDMGGYNNTLARVRDLLEPTDHVLEIGCGTGTTALALAAHVKQITASDVSSEMIAIANEKAVAQGCGNAVFSAGTVGDMAAPAGGFDAVMAFNLLHLLPDLQGDLHRIYGLLKPGGLFISKTTCLSEMSAVIRFAVPVMQAVRMAPFVSFFRAEALMQQIVQAGFEIVETARHGTGAKDPRIFILARKPS